MDYFAANDIAAFSIFAGSPTEGTTAGRFDATYTTKGIVVGSTNYEIESAPFTNPATGAVTPLTDFWLHYEQFGVVAGSFQIILYNSANVPVLRISAPALTIRVEYWDGAAWQIGGTTAAFPGDGNKHSYDWHIVCGAAGSVTMYGDQGGPYITVAGLNAAVTNVQYFHVKCINNNGNLTYSQFLVSDVSTVSAKVATPAPNANGTNVAWTGDYLSVTKVGYNDATMITSAVLGDKESYAATDVSLPVGYGISSVWFAARGRLGAASPVNFKALMRIGAVDYSAGYNFPGLTSAAFAPALTGFTLDPSTGTAWTLANVNAAELGFVSAA